MQKGFGFFAKIALIAILFFLAFSIITKNIEINELKDKKEALQQEIDQAKLEVERMESQMEDELDEETVKRIAKDKLNLREAGDVSYQNDLPE